MPAWSATCALGKSCAVIMVMGSFFLYMLCSVLMVTGLRRLIGEDPRGECELHRTCSGYAGDEYCVARQGCDRVRSVFMRARDMVKSDWNVVQVSWLENRCSAGRGRTIGKQNQQPWLVWASIRFYEAVQEVAL